MASIKKYGTSWRATIKKKGFKTIVRHFPTKKLAEEFALPNAYNYIREDNNMEADTKQLQGIRVREWIEKYRDEYTPYKGSARSETATLNALLRRAHIVDRSVSSFRKKDAYAYQRERMLETTNTGHALSYRTVVKEFAILHRIWEVAKEQWGYQITWVNPWGKLDAPQGHKKSHRRTRRLKNGELSRILLATSTSHELVRLIVRIAIHLTIETGLRLQELMKLEWKDIDFENRRIVVTKSKTDLKQEVEGRTIVMTLRAKHYLKHLQINLIWSDPIGEKPFHPNRRVRPDSHVFPPTEEGNDREVAFGKIFRDILKRAHIPGQYQPYTRGGVTVQPDGIGLKFHDLRHEAGSIFDAAGLTKGQHDLMMGHKNRDMASIYIHAELSEIQKKLDAYHIPQIRNDPFLLPEEKDFILNGPKANDEPDIYKDDTEDGSDRTYILVEGKRVYQDDEPIVIDVPA